MNLSALPTMESDGAITLVSLRNARVESFIEAMQGLPELGIVLIPHEVMSVPPGEEPDRHLAKAGVRSPLEIYLYSLSSVGEWASFLAFAAMLVAPYPNPVLNTAIATARGNVPLLLGSAGRYFLALGIGVITAYGLSALYGVHRAGAMAEALASLSSAAVLLPLSAGIVGGLYLSESEESSMVTAAGAGLLVTAALSPPVAILGISLWTGYPRPLIDLTLLE